MTLSEAKEIIEAQGWRILKEEVYEKEYTFLSESKIAEYEEKIKLAKESALRQFKDNFLAKLKSNFDAIHMQIDNLNFALANSRFGTDSYCFKLTPRREYAAYYEKDPMGNCRSR